MTKKLRVPEKLEDRLALTVFGVPWPEPGHLTFSFAPDGTPVGSAANTLAETLNSQFSSEDWRLDALRAMQTWISRVNIDVGVVGDGGQALGTSGANQGDPRFGDIRLAAAKLTEESVATTTPFSLLAGTWAGDVVLNSDYVFGDDPDAFDLTTVLLHEFGHVLGLDHSADAQSPLTGGYSGARPKLAASDIAAMTSLYGVRLDDAFDRFRRNDTNYNASRIDLNGSETNFITADLTRSSDVDWYSFKAPANDDQITIVLRTEGISLLAGRIRVFDSQGRQIGKATKASPLEDDAVVHLRNLKPGERYFVKIDAPSGRDGFVVGGYRLEFQGESLSVEGDKNDSSGPSGPSGPSAQRALSGDEMEQAVTLEQGSADSPNRFRFTGDWSEEAQLFQVRSPQSSESNLVMTASVRSLSAGSVDPLVRVYDRDGNRVPSQVLVNQEGEFSLQLQGLNPDEDYFVEILPNHATTQAIQGQFELQVDFASPVTTAERFASGTLTQDSNQEFQALEIDQTQVLYLGLGANTSPEADSVTAVRMTIYDESGEAVFTLMARAGEFRTGTVLLKKGTYSIRVAGGTRDGSDLMATDYRVVGAALSDPIGPRPIDPTLDPKGSGGAPPVVRWTPSQIASILKLIDAYSKPWW